MTDPHEDLVEAVAYEAALREARAYVERHDGYAAERLLSRIDAALSAASGEASRDGEPHYVRRARACGVFAQAERIKTKFGPAPSEAPNVERARMTDEQLCELRDFADSHVDCPTTFPPSTVLSLSDELLELRARIAELEEELATWKSVFPDIAPERVQPDRSKLEKHMAELEKERDLANHFLHQAQAAYDTLAKERDSARAEGIAAMRERCAKIAESLEQSQAALAETEARIKELERVADDRLDRELVMRAERDALSARLEAAKKALKPFRGFWSDNELKGLPDCHLFEMIWARDEEDRLNEETGKPYPAITVGQLRRARAAIAEMEK